MTENIKNNKLFKEIKDTVFSLDIFDTHEHLIPEKERRSKELDLFILFSHYTGTDLITSGMEEATYSLLFDTRIDLEKRWSYFSSHWKNIKNTSYSKTILEATKDLYDLDDINEKNYIELSEKINLTKNKEWYDFVIKDKSNITYILNDIEFLGENKFKTVDRKDFRPVMNFDEIISICCKEDIFGFEKKFDSSVYKLKDLLDSIDEIFEDMVKMDYKATKIAISYMRTLKFEETPFYEAEKTFSKLYTLEDYSYLEKKDFLSKKELKPFQDYLVHYIIEKSAEHNLPVQIHTGFLEGVRNNISNSNPSLLNNLFLKYGKCTFDIFHAGYPYTDELISICKIFPNVYFNLCWIPEISPSLYKNILNLLIEIIPSNKIFGYGGDYEFIEGTYASQKLTRRIISELLYEKIRKNYFSFDEAIDFAEKILFTNPNSIYGWSK